MKIFYLILCIQVLNSCTNPIQEKKDAMTQIMEDKRIDVKKDAITELRKLISTKKFGPEPQSPTFPLGYVGLLPKENQPRADALLNASIERIILLLEKEPTKYGILNEYKDGLKSMEDVAFDTEDRERVCEYYDQIRVIIGFDSTDGVLNDWLY